MGPCGARAIPCRAPGATRRTAEVGGDALRGPEERAFVVFGATPTWHGSCVVLVDGAASVKTTGTDAIVAGGVKSFAPRITSGRVQGEAVCFLPEHNTLLVVQRTHSKQSTGEDLWQQTLIVLDSAHVVGVEFETIDRLTSLGLAVPPLPDKPRYAAGTLVG